MAANKSDFQGSNTVRKMMRQMTYGGTEIVASQGAIAHLGKYIEGALNPRFKVDMTPGHKPGHWRMVVCLVSER